MHIFYDQDEWKSVSESRPCTACGGELSKCNGACSGMASFGQVRRAPDEITRIKAERLRRDEDEILARAEAIKASRPQR